MSGKRQRPSYLEIDEKTLEYKEDPQKKEQNEDKGPPISERKIYKIKGLASAPEQQAGKAKFTLFGSAGNEAQKKQSKGDEKSNQLNTQKPKQQKKPSTGMFGSSTSSGTSLFGNGTGLFSNSGNHGLGLFSSSTSNNIFSKKSQDSSEKGESAKPPTGSIFQSSGNSIFSFSSNLPPIKKGESKGNDEDDEGDSQQLERQQNKEIDPSKSSGKYEYQIKNKLLFQGLAVKLKKPNGDLVENVEIVAQQDLQNKTNWIVVRLPATKNIILSGLLLKGKSQVKKMGAKDENATISIFKLKKQGLPQQQILKIQFQESENGIKFRETVEGILK